jgi:hypothetical protein
MSFSESYDECMGRKGLPLLGEVFSRKSLSEAAEIIEEIDDVLEAAGGKEITFTALAAMGPLLGLSDSALEVIGVLAAAGVNVAVHVYAIEAAKCLGFAALKNSLLSELDDIPDGVIKDQIASTAGTGTAAA